MPTPAPSPSSAVPSPPLRICNVIGIFGVDWGMLPRYRGHHLGDNKDFRLSRPPLFDDLNT